MQKESKNSTGTETEEDCTEIEIMDITYYNAKEYILLSLGINVSMPMLWKKNSKKIDVPFGDRYMQNICNKLKREMLIRYDENEKLIYLTPKGIDELKKLNREVYLHYMDITSNHTVSGKVKKKSMEKTSTVHHFFSDGEINGIRLVYSANYFNQQKEFDEMDNMLPFKVDSHVFEGEGTFTSLIRSADVRGTHLYSTLLIKKDPDFNYGSNSKIYLSQMKAFLLLNGYPYFVYCDLTTETYTRVIEMQFARNLLTAYSQVFGMGEYRKIIKDSPKGDGMFLYSSTENIYKYFFSGIDTKLNKVFTRCYIIPCANTEDFKEEDGKYIIELLGIEGIRKKICKSLYKEESDGLSDGCVNGVPAWEFLTSDFNKIEVIAEYKEAIITCYEWQKEIIETLLPNVKMTFNILTKRNALLELMKGDRKWK